MANGYNGYGGARPGAGRPKKSAEERRLSGNAGHRGRVLAHPSSPPQVAAPPAPVVVDVDEAEAPNELTLEERQAWVRLARFVDPKLRKDYEYAFALLSRNVALERRYALSVQDAGGSSHRGLITIIDRELVRFGLAPMGKATAEEPAKPQVNPLQEKYFAR